MQRRAFGPDRALLPVIGLGTWQMEDDDPRGVIASVHRAIELGATHIDTAELYGHGRVEELLGQALAGRRDRVFLVSKVLPRHASRKGTIAACEASLRRLGTDHLDLYLLHWRETEPLAETFAAFEALRAAGKIRAWGVSNFDVDDLEQAEAIAGPGKITCNQVLYHLAERTIEHDVVPWCEARGIAVVGYSPFGSRGATFPPRKGAAVLEEIAATRGLTARQIALAFLTRRPSLFAIPKSSQPDRVAENVAAGDVALDDDEVARLDGAFPRGRWRGLPTL